LQQRNAAIDNPLLGMHLGSPQAHFLRVSNAAGERAIKNVQELRVVAEQLQQRFSAGTPAADAEQVFGGGIDVFNEKILIDDDDGRDQVLEHVVALRWFTAAAAFAAASLLAV
jgi:hypothetical protein